VDLIPEKNNLLRILSVFDEVTAIDILTHKDSKDLTVTGFYGHYGDVQKDLCIAEINQFVNIKSASFDSVDYCKEYMRAIKDIQEGKQENRGNCGVLDCICCYKIIKKIILKIKGEI
jgi:hypothetical protein